MYAIIGIDKNSKPILWKPDENINPHMIVTGVSGSGKTHFLRQLIHQLCSTSTTPVRFHLIDIHEDIEVPGASTLKFTATQPYGFNPLVVDPNPDSGGPQKAVASFLSLLGKTANYKLGDRQVACIQNLLIDLYAKRGFFQDNPKSWRLDDGYARTVPKRYPTLRDAFHYANSIYNEMFIGLNSPTLAALREALKAQRSVVRQKKIANQKGLKHQESKQLRDAIDRFHDEMTTFVHKLSFGDGEELDKMMKYPSQDVMSGVIDRLSKLNFMGFFSGETPPFDPNAKVWRYCLKSLEIDESIIFVHTLAKSIFNNAKMRSEGNDKIPRDFIIIDEARRFQDPEGSILDVISAESRKFGLALISASQAHAHFTGDAIQAAATQVILRQDPSSYNKVKNLTGVPVDDLAAIKPRENALIKIMLSPQNEFGPPHQSRALDYESVTVNTAKIASVLGIEESKISPKLHARPQQGPHDQPLGNGHQIAPYAPTIDQVPATSHEAELNYHTEQNVQKKQKEFQKPEAPAAAPATQGQTATGMPSSPPSNLGSQIDVPDIDEDFDFQFESSTAPAMPNSNGFNYPFSPPAAPQQSSAAPAHVDYSDNDDIDPFAGVSVSHRPTSTQHPQNKAEPDAGYEKADDLISSHFGYSEDHEDQQSQEPEDEDNPLSLKASAIKPPAPKTAEEILAKLKVKNAGVPPANVNPASQPKVSHVTHNTAPTSAQPNRAAEGITQKDRTSGDAAGIKKKLMF